MSDYLLGNVQFKKVVKALQGTSHTIDEVLHDILPQHQLEETDLHPDSLAEIRSQIFWCDECGLWLLKRKQSEFEHLCKGCSTDVWESSE